MRRLELSSGIFPTSSLGHLASVPVKTISGCFLLLAFAIIFFLDPRRCEGSAPVAVYEGDKRNVLFPLYPELNDSKKTAYSRAIEHCAESIRACPDWKSKSDFDAVCLQNVGTAHADGIGCSPRRFSWQRGCSPGNSTLYVIAAADAAFAPVWKECGCKILVTVEPPAIVPHIIENIATYYMLADIILANFEATDDPLQKIFPFAFGTTWIPDAERRVYKKTKNVSIIASAKNFTTGHQLRHTVIAKYSKSFHIDLYGAGYRSLDSKSDGLRDYRYSLIIENSREAYYITEKLIDAFLTGTLPIYWGAKVAGELFDNNGIITFQNETDIADFISLATPEYYKKRRSAVLLNFEKALQYVCPDERMQTYFFGPVYDLLARELALK